MNATRTFAALALGLSLALPAAAAEAPAAAAPDSIVVAQDAGPRMGRPDGPGGQHRHHGPWQRQFRHRRPPSYAGIALRHQAELGLNPQQVEALRKIAIDNRRAGIQRRADLQIAGLDLMTLRRAEPVDLPKVEAKVREMEKMRADGQIARFRADEQSKAQLTADQRDKLKALMMARWQQRQQRSESDEPNRPAVAEERG